MVLKNLLRDRLSVLTSAMILAVLVLTVPLVTHSVADPPPACAWCISTDCLYDPTQPNNPYNGEFTGFSTEVLRCVDYDNQPPAHCSLILARRWVTYGWNG